MKLREAILESIISNFIEFCKQELQLNELPPIHILNEPFIEHNDLRSFGEFNGREINVASLNRHPMDVLRTLAHELTHWKQNLNGDVMNGDDGSNTENTANAIAGVIMRKFSKQYPECFVL